MDHAAPQRHTVPNRREKPPPADPAHLHAVRRKAIFGYAYLVTPGIALLGLALFDAVTAQRWMVFIGLSVALGFVLFYLPLVSHFRCASCRGFFRFERRGLEAGETIYRCIVCGHTKREREWCGMTDILKSSRRLKRK